MADIKCQNYIHKYKCLEYVLNHNACEKCECRVRNPVIEELEKQKTGKWIGDWFSPKCSVCGKKPLYERYYGVDGEETSLLKSPYCPYCGAKMEGE